MSALWWQLSSPQDWNPWVYHINRHLSVDTGKHSVCVCVCVWFWFTTVGRLIIVVSVYSWSSGNMKEKDKEIKKWCPFPKVPVRNQLQNGLCSLWWRSATKRIPASGSSDLAKRTLKKMHASRYHNFLVRKFASNSVEALSENLRNGWNISWPGLRWENLWIW